jgi:hypothetical protein
MAVFYPYLVDDRGGIPDRNAHDYRIAAFLGATESEELVPGPILDTASIDDVHMILMLVGVELEQMQAIRRTNGEVDCFAWIGLDSVLSLRPEITFALEEPAAREFLLDLKNAAALMNAIGSKEGSGCMIAITLPDGA